MPHIESDDGVSIFYQEVGGGRPVVLVHGWACNHTFWERQVTDIAKSYRTISIDLRGHGMSDKPISGYAIGRHCQDIKNVMEALTLENATLVGWSTGGRISIQYAATVGDHISHLGLVSCAPRFVSNDKFPYGLPLERVKEFIEKERADRPASRWEFMEALLYKRPSIQKIAWMWMNSMQCPTYAGVQLLEALIEYDTVDVLSNIKVPTRIFQGRYDTFCSAPGAEWMAKRIEGAEIVMFEALGHAPHLEDPEAFNTSLMEFLDSR
jgi:pimeloyl-ACP methyl ester carboxylesterase